MGMFDCNHFLVSNSTRLDKGNNNILINVDVNLLTKGSDTLTYQENKTIFKHVFKYIEDSKKDLQLSNVLKNQHTSPKVFIFLSFLSYIVSLCFCI
jgi:hypothetical protein